MIFAVIPVITLVSELTAGAYAGHRLFHAFKGR